MWTYLTRERISDIKAFFATANTPYDSDLRTLLLDGINFQYVGQLKRFPNDAFQLSGDLSALNSVERLADGTIPLEVWLRNALDQLSFRDTSNILSRALDEVTNRKTTAAPIVNPSSVPNLVEAREKIIHRDDLVAYGFLAGGFEAGKSVARLQVLRHDNGALSTGPMGTEVHQGTGWLVGPDLIITNHHVVNARTDGQQDAPLQDLELQARNTVVQFDFDGQTTSGNSIKAKELVAFDPALDYAVLRLESLPSRKPLTVDPRRIEVDKDSYIAVNIIQHPNGGPKKVAIRNNLVYDSKFPRLRYYTDTDHGSSGSPVLNDAWQVVALHRASTFVADLAVQGQSNGWVNEGTQMAAIVEDIKVKDPKLYEELTGK